MSDVILDNLGLGVAYNIYTKFSSKSRETLTEVEAILRTIFFKTCFNRYMQKQKGNGVMK